MPTWGPRYGGESHANWNDFNPPARRREDVYEEIVRKAARPGAH